VISGVPLRQDRPDLGECETAHFTNPDGSGYPEPPDE
jgi:hypothetical protein